MSDLVLREDLDRSEMRRALILAHLPVSYMNTAICSNCALEAVAVVAPDIRSEFEIVSVEMEL